ncbi:XdhC/CoxI family protein [Cobetia sp. Dlab-2-AX]|uniref:XdhC family protein n=1 Tax=Cobetia sp. Dlab-2-AX TaxID=2954488 RepID=UPI0020983D26|nr:XdhC/CoxI family protein [Cobetia sp. Dlab-2-AX]
MGNHISHILSTWIGLKDTTDWVLGTVFSTVGSSYRKPGAMMMFSGQGHQLGLLSGGCLESDIQRHARRVMLSGKSLQLEYDGNNEDDISFQLGIGCGGVVRILLQPVSVSNGYLQLEDMFYALAGKRTGYYHVDLAQRVSEFTNRFQTGSVGQGDKASLNTSVGASELRIPVRPVPHLLIAGGGVDARPLARIATELGWSVTVWDPRPANAREEYFETVSHLVRGDLWALATHVSTHPVNAAVIMTHSISLDAAALGFIADLNPAYAALLGPSHRRQEVLAKAGLEKSVTAQILAGPAGLDLGGELPETIALAILAECQAKLSGHSAASLSFQLATPSPAFDAAESFHPHFPYQGTCPTGPS